MLGRSDLDIVSFLTFHSKGRVAAIWSKPVGRFELLLQKKKNAWPIPIHGGLAAFQKRSDNLNKKGSVNAECRWMF